VELGKQYPSPEEYAAATSRLIDELNALGGIEGVVGFSQGGELAVLLAERAAELPGLRFVFSFGMEDVLKKRGTQPLALSGDIFVGLLKGTEDHEACPINLRTQWLEVGSPPWSVVTREFSGKHEMPGERVKHTYPAMVKDTQEHIVKRVFAQTLKGLHAARQVEAQRLQGAADAIEIECRALSNKNVQIRVLLTDTIAMLKDQVQREMTLKYCDHASEDYDQYWEHAQHGLPKEDIRFTTGPPPKGEKLSPWADSLTLAECNVRPIPAQVNLCYWKGRGVFYTYGQ